MAQLHGRIRRVPHPRVTRVRQRLICAAILTMGGSATLSGAPRVASGQDHAAAVGSASVQASDAGRDAELDALSAQLASDDARVRAGAFAALRQLDESSLDAIERRIRTRASRRPSPEAITSALAEIRRATGSRRADDPIDLSLGVLPALATRRDAAMIAACESILLWRALEQMGTSAAFRLIADLVALDGGAWEQETHRVVERVGARLGPMLIEVRSHPSPALRRWSRWATTELGFDQPGRAIQLPVVANDTTLLADTLRAWGAVHDLSAIRVVVSFTGSEHGEVRDAARAALAQLGRNAIWVVREQLTLVSGREADPRWGWERTHRALLEAHDDARLAPVRAELAQGEVAAARGELEFMGACFDRVLLRAPELAQRDRMADGYARLGAFRREREDLVGAARALRRAVSLAHAGDARARWLAELRAVQADLDLARGVADLHAYRARMTNNATDGFAASVVARLTGLQATESRNRRRIAAACAAVLALLGVFALLFRRQPLAVIPAPDPSTDPQTEEDPSDTSPGSLGAVA
jgi:hypothetical protein